MEDKNYIGLAQLYSLMKDVSSNNPMSSEKLLAYEKLENLHRMINDVLQQGININCRVKASDFFKGKMPHLIGSTALHLAAERDDICVFNYLIKKGADFTVKNADQLSVLHQMIYKSDYKKYFDSVTFEGNLYQNPFVESVLSAHIEHENPSNPCDKNGMSHFSVACMMNNVKAVEFFLKHGVSVNETHREDPSSPTGYSTPLHFAAKYCAVEVVQALLNHGADLTAKDSSGVTALQVLVEEKMKIWAKRTRMMSMDMSDKPKTFIALIKLFERNEKIMKMMLDSYRNDWADIDFVRFYAVCTMQNTSMVEHFLSNKVGSYDQAIDAESPFCPGYTALHFAAHFNANTVKLLMKKGASMEMKDANGVTPFDICMRTFKVEDIQAIMLLRDDWSSITFLKGKAKLLDFINSMQEPKLFEDYLRSKVANMRTFVSLNSPICPGYTPLHLAVACTETCPSNWTDRVIRMPRYFARIATCLSLGADVTAKNGDGSTAVHQAFRLCENRVVSQLFQYQKRLANPVDSHGLSHFHVACAANCKNLAQKLIADGIDVNSPIKSGFKWYKEHSHCETSIASGLTPLHLVAGVADVAMVGWLVERNANVFAKDADGLTAIERAAEARLHALKVHICSKTAKLYVSVIDSLRTSVFSKAIVNNNTNDFHTLYQIVQRISNDNFTLHWLYNEDKRHRRIVDDERIFESVFKRMGITKLHLACVCDRLEQVREQLDDDGADVNARISEDSPVYPGCTPLHLAVLCQQFRINDAKSVCTDILDLLLMRGADVTIANCDRRTAIHQAFECFSCRDFGENYPGNNRLFDALLQGHEDFSINPKDDSGLSHFHLACYRNKKDIVKKFINKRVNVNQTVDHFRIIFGGYTPLHFAMTNPSKETVSLLLKHRADVHAKDRLGNTPLHVIVKCNKLLISQVDQVISSVLTAGADINAKSMLHLTPLEMLLDKEEVTRNTVANFIRRGAHVNIVNPISSEGYLSKFVRKNHWNKSIFRETLNAQDIRNVDENGFTAMHNIVSTHVEWYYRRSDDDSIENARFLSYAEGIEILADSQIDIDSQDKEGMTALHLAIKNRNTDGIIGLLMNGADVNVIDANGNTPFTFSSQIYSQTLPNSNDKLNLKSIEFMIYRDLTMHVHKLLFAEIHVNKINQQMYAKTRKTFFFRNMDNCYKAEMQELGKQQIGSSSIKLRDFLSETGAVASYPHIMQTERQEIHEFFKNSVTNLHKQYPMMTSLLKLQYRKALVRAGLLSRSAVSINLLLGFDLPLLCSDPLIRLLANEDLKRIIDLADIM